MKFFTRHAKTTTRIQRQVYRSLRLENLQRRELMASDLSFAHDQPPISISAEEQVVVELINRARANPSAEASRLGMGLNDNLPSNQMISSTPKQPLAPVFELQHAAELHSKDLLDRDYFDHMAKTPAPNGVSPSDRAIRAAMVPA